MVEMSGNQKRGGGTHNLAPLLFAFALVWVRQCGEHLRSLIGDGGHGMPPTGSRTILTEGAGIALGHLAVLFHVTHCEAEKEASHRISRSKITTAIVYTIIL